jgi:quinate dehydrogenase (quinone)
MFHAVGRLACAILLGALAFAPTASEWTHRDGDSGARRFSPLKQITPANVARLKPAWTFDTGATNLQVTPLVIGGVMYLTAGSNVLALEPETGKVVWAFQAPAVVSRRGLAYWPGDGKTGARLFTGAGDRMLAIDVKTGKPAPDFGEGGSVDLKLGITGDVDGRISMASPPSIFKDIVITGGNNGEGAPSFGLYGDIRGWDARSGRLLWSFHTVPRPGEPGVETWEGDSWRNRSGTNVWSFFTVDVDRGLVFAPLGSPTSDYYGADRKGKNLYGNSIVALDAATGKLKWFQQLVHHDIWDYDLPSAPTLIDVSRDGRTIPAVAVITKMTTLFIFNRETGEPIFGMEERAVPQSTVPGEQTWPTQPFPVKPPPLGRMTFDPAKDFYTLTPDHAAYCRQLWDSNRMYTKGPFTPPGTDGMMLTFPSTLGGGNWNGFAYDAALGLLVTNVMNLGQVAKMTERADRSGQRGWARSTPWGGSVGRFWNPESKIPCSAPPFGELVAVDVNTAEIAWKVPLGFVEELKAKGLGHTGALNIGGPMMTASGLVFVGASTDRRFRAFDSRSGQQLWEAELEASAHSVPMTFMGRDDRQYVVIAAGGGSFLSSAPGTKIVAFSLAGGATTTTLPAVASAAVAAAALRSLPPGDGRDATVKMCSGCHGIQVAVARRRTALEWQGIVQAMSDRGAPGTPSDVAATVRYLGQYFGR